MLRAGGVSWCKSKSFPILDFCLVDSAVKICWEHLRNKAKLRPRSRRMWTCLLPLYLTVARCLDLLRGHVKGPLWDWSYCKLPREAAHFIDNTFFDQAGFLEKDPMIVHLRSRRMVHVRSSICMMGLLYLILLMLMRWLMHQRWT